MRALIPALLAIALLSPAAAAGAGIKPWIGADGSWGNYTMGDANDVLADLNAELTGTPLHLWEVDAGPAVGFSAGADLGFGLSLGVGYQRLFSASGVDGAGWYEQFRLPANGITAIAEYAPPTKGPFGVRFGIAGGALMETGSIVLGGVESELTGTGPLVETYVGLDWLAQPRCRLMALLGYRSARIEDAKLAEPAATDLERAKLTLDYSGMMARLGVRVPLGAVAGAKDTARDPAVRPWLGAGASWNVYKHIPDFDYFDRVRHGFPFGATAGVDLPRGFCLGGGYDRLPAKADALAGGTGKLDFAANAWWAFVERRLVSVGSLEARLGASAGAVMETGSVEGDGKATLTGSGPVLGAHLGLHWKAAPRVAVVSSFGYRHVRVSELKADRVVIYDTKGRRVRPDYSGVDVRLGVRVPLVK